MAGRLLPAAIAYCWRRQSTGPELDRRVNHARCPHPAQCLGLECCQRPHGWYGRWAIVVTSRGGISGMRAIECRQATVLGSRSSHVANRLNRSAQAKDRCRRSNPSPASNAPARPPLPTAGHRRAGTGTTPRPGRSTASQDGSWDLTLVVTPRWDFNAHRRQAGSQRSTQRPSPSEASRCPGRNREGCGRS